jgi:hypothetical protein
VGLVPRVHEHAVTPEDQYFGHSGVILAGAETMMRALVQEMVKIFLMGITCGLKFLTSVCLTFLTFSVLGANEDIVVHFIHIDDPYVEQDDTIVEDTVVDTTISIEETTQTPHPTSEFWEGQDSLIIDEEPFVEDCVPRETPNGGDYAINSRLATLHLIKHYKEGPGTW